MWHSKERGSKDRDTHIREKEIDRQAGGWPGRQADRWGSNRGEKETATEGKQETPIEIDEEGTDRQMRQRHKER